MSPKLSCVDKTNEKGLMPRIEKLAARLIIYSHSSTNPENLAKIGPIDVQIIGLTVIVKKKYKK